MTIKFKELERNIAACKNSYENIYSKSFKDTRSPDIEAALTAAIEADEIDKAAAMDAAVLKSQPQWNAWRDAINELEHYKTSIRA